MQPISQSTPSFLQALQASESIGITTDGNWYKKGLFDRISVIFRHIFFGYDETVENARNLAAFISTPELVRGASHGVRQSASLNAESVLSMVAAVKATLKKKAMEEECTITALTEKRAALSASSPQSSIVELNRKIFNPECWKNRLAVATLDRAWMAYRYLGTDQRTIDTTEISEDDVRWLENELETWQQQQFPYVKYVHGKNHSFILEKIRQCCRYKEFIAVAKEDRALLELCFLSTFKSMPDTFAQSIDVFLQLPNIQDQLKKTFLDKRICEIANDSLRFIQLPREQETLLVPNDRPIKDIKILIDGEHQSITDGSRCVRIAKGLQQTVSEVFKEFEAQNFRFIRMEYLQDKGITAFDARLPLGFNLDTKEWWRDLPVLRRMTRAQIEESYGVDFRDGYALFLIRGSRTSPDLSADGTHGWSNIIYPLDDGTFNVIAPGKFSDGFPVTMWETFCHIFRTHRACVTILDANEFMNSRERIAISFPPLTKEKFESVMEDLRRELLKSRNEELIFQAQGDNCASWVHQFMRRNWPGLALEPYSTLSLDLNLPPILKPIISARALFPNDASWQSFRRIFCSMFGALKTYVASDGKGGTRNIRLFDNADWQKGIIQLPARLWKEKERLVAQLSEYATKIAQ